MAAMAVADEQSISLYFMGFRTMDATLLRKNTRQASRGVTAGRCGTSRLCSDIVKVAAGRA
jgi:hypothetical protein